jgi:N-acetyl-anhydromuramyl-L-alanine amidase AmpD
MKIINVINKLPWKNSNGKMNKNKMDIVVIHHDAVDMPARYNSLTRLQQEARTHIAKLYGHISYHYSIDNIGDIYQCLLEDEVAYHCGNLTINRNSLAIKFDGNFEFQKPTSQQIKAYKELMIWLTTKRPDLPKIIRSSVRGHRQIKSTACPGKNLYPLITKF